MTMIPSYLFYSFISFMAVAQSPGSATATVPAHLVPTIETSVDRSEILIGDVFRLTVTLTHDPSVRIVQRETGLDLGQFEIKEIHPGGQETLPDGSIKESIEYQLSTFFTGDFEIPAFEILYQTADGVRGSLQTTPIHITVRSLTPEEAEDLDIRDIKEPVLLEGQSRMWIVWTVLASLVALAFLVYFVWRYYKNRTVEVPLPPPLPPHEEALLALQELRDNREWIDNREYKLFSTRISEIIRRYLQRRWSINALDETTEEILSNLKSLSLENALYGQFNDFFLDCDLMKFAKHELPEEELMHLIDNAVQIVEQTKEITPSSDNKPAMVSETTADTEVKTETSLDEEDRVQPVHED